MVAAPVAAVEGGCKAALGRPPDCRRLCTPPIGVNPTEERLKPLELFDVAENEDIHLG